MSDQPSAHDDDIEISIDEFLRLLDAVFEQLARELFPPPSPQSESSAVR